MLPKKRRTANDFKLETGHRDRKCNSLRLDTLVCIEPLHQSHMPHMLVGQNIGKIIDRRASNSLRIELLEPFVRIAREEDRLED